MHCEEDIVFKFSPAHKSFNGDFLNTMLIYFFDDDDGLEALVMIFSNDCGC